MLNTKPKKEAAGKKCHSQLEPAPNPSSGLEAVLKLRCSSPKRAMGSTRLVARLSVPQPPSTSNSVAVSQPGAVGTCHLLAAVSAGMLSYVISHLCYKSSLPSCKHRTRALASASQPSGRSGSKCLCRVTGKAGHCPCAPRPSVPLPCASTAAGNRPMEKTERWCRFPRGAQNHGRRALQIDVFAAD